MIYIVVHYEIYIYISYSQTIKTSECLIYFMYLNTFVVLLPLYPCNTHTHTHLLILQTLALFSFDCLFLSQSINCFSNKHKNTHLHAHLHNRHCQFLHLSLVCLHSPSSHLPRLISSFFFVFLSSREH